MQALYHLTKTLDSSRPVIGNDGWESVATDIIGIHDYDGDPARIAQRYRTEEQLPKLLRRARPGGRLLVLEGETDRPGDAHRVRRPRPAAGGQPRLGLLACLLVGGVRGPLPAAARGGALGATCSPASATRSSPTRTRSRRASSTATAPPRFPSIRSPKRRRGLRPSARPRSRRPATCCPPAARAPATARRPPSRRTTTAPLPRRSRRHGS